jgi:hypothetical protein
VQQVIDSAYPSVMLDDKDIDVCCDAGAEKYADDPPQREVADQDVEHHDPWNAWRDPAAGRRPVCVRSAHKNVGAHCKLLSARF